MKNQKGSMVVWIALIVVIAGGVWWWMSKSNTPTTATPTTSTQSQQTLSASPSSGTAPLEVGFEAAAINTQALADTASVDFGDGTTDQLVLQCKGGIGGAAVCGGAAATHTYSSAGSYTAKLMLGGVAVATSVVSVSK